MRGHAFIAVNNNGKHLSFESYERFWMCVKLTLPWCSPTKHFQYFRKILLNMNIVVFIFLFHLRFVASDLRHLRVRVFWMAAHGIVSFQNRLFSRAFKVSSHPFLSVHPPPSESTRSVTQLFNFGKLVRSRRPRLSSFAVSSSAYFPNWWSILAQHRLPLIISDHYVYLINLLHAFFPLPFAVEFKGPCKNWINNTFYEPGERSDPFVVSLHLPCLSSYPLIVFPQCERHKPNNAWWKDILSVCCCWPESCLKRSHGRGGGLKTGRNGVVLFGLTSEQSRRNLLIRSQVLMAYLH